MNDVNILLLEQQKKQNNDKILLEYGLNSESIEIFRTKIRQVSDEEGKSLGKKLYEFVSSKNFNDEKSVDSILELIYNGADVEYKEEEKGNFALLVCARKNYFKTFLILLRAGANVNQKNNYLTTATMASARHGNKDILNILILMGADINAKCLDGDTALLSARYHKKVECFNMLIDSGAYLNVTSQSGKSIYTEAPDEKINLKSLENGKKVLNKKVSQQDVEELLKNAIVLKEVIEVTDTHSKQHTKKLKKGNET